MAGINGFPGFINDFVRGTTKDFKITMSQDGVPIDITGCKFYITIAVDLDPETIPDLEITIDPPTDPLNGATTGTITDTQTYALTAQTYVYSVRFINIAGAAYVIDMGKLKVLEAVSSRIE